MTPVFADQRPGALVTAKLAGTGEQDARTQPQVHLPAKALRAGTPWPPSTVFENAATGEGRVVEACAMECSSSLLVLCLAPFRVSTPRQDPRSLGAGSNGSAPVPC